MNQYVYQIIHLSGVIAFFAAMGAAIYTPSSKDNKLAAIIHGIALLLIFVSGFGLIAKIWGNQWSWWMICKLIIWLLLGASYGLVKKRLLPENMAFGIVVGLGVLAAILGNIAYFGV